MPTSNSTGEFIYTATSQGINPATNQPTTQPTSLSVAGNQIIPINDGSQGLQARISIQAFQNSSASFSSLAATFPNNIDLINTRAVEFIMSTGNSPNFSENINTANPSAFVVCVPFNSAFLTGFSFQFFGGYQPFGGGTPINFTVDVSVSRSMGGATWIQVGRLIISFTALSVPDGIRDGTLAYIPFNQYVNDNNNNQPIITTPTLVNNLTYNLTTAAHSPHFGGFSSALQPGDLVSVNMSGTSPMLSRVMQGYGTASLRGSLLFNTINNRPTNSTNNLFGSGPELIIASSGTIFNVSDINGRNDIILMDVRISGIGFSDTTLPAPTFENPYMITINISVRNDNNAQIYTNAMTIAICSWQTDVVVVPFDMPVRGSMFSREVNTGTFYYVESINPWFNSNHFTSADGFTRAATFSYPRIFQSLGQGPFTYEVWINTSVRPLRIFRGALATTNIEAIMCQLNWVGL